ncbi:MAG: VWA domain-containing protein [Ruminococcaceae bacterium]|nr:VWA domain-containing protein [Oscillospiraceae bacterium]
MLNFKIAFERPWLLLLLIPALFFGVLPYFRSPKKYRRTRNRITSVVLHCTALALGILVLAGITFQYDLPNKEHEVILLVDKSDSNEKSDSLKDEFVAEVLRNTKSSFKVGVVTFGYDQVYAAALNTNANAVYQEYLRSPSPDTSGTDFEAALKYAASLFTKPESARIVILSDGVETDGNANAVIRSLASTGIKLDTVHFPDEKSNDIQILAVHYPDTTIRHGETFEITLDIESTFEGIAKLSMFDDATQIGESLEVRLVRGTQQIVMEAVLPIPGLHKLTFEVESVDDLNVKNNVYNSHLYIEVFDKLLIIESIAGESESLCNILNGKKITVVNSYDTDKMPKTLNDLRKYDEIIMVNVANADLPDGFDQLLFRYVKDIGGGLFTICGNKDDGNPNDDLFEANAFTEADMGNSLYQELLPVEIIEYTPPVAVVIIIDTSGSMYSPNVPYETTKLYAAQQGALSCLEALTERDWVGVMTFADQSAQSLEITRRVERDKIISAINNLPKTGGNTKFTHAINDAGDALAALTAVERRHIILVTDGQPQDDEEDYGAAMKKNADRGITMSIVGIEADEYQKQMEFALQYYAGMPADHFHNVKGLGDAGTEMRKDLDLPAITDVNYETFVPAIKNHSSVVNGIDATTIPHLDGFYGTKLKADATEILGGEFVPIYAQWKYGKGSVGSFLCDLNGTWSSEFIESEVGQELVTNMVEALYPLENIQIPSIRLALKEHNYRSELNIFADADPTDTVSVEVISRFNSDIPTQVFYPSAGEEFGKVDIEIKMPGVYEICVMRQDSEGNLLAQYSIYKAFSYSAEYNILTDTTTYAQKLADISEAGEGVVLTEPYEVFENAVKYLHKVIDPRIALIITALVVFLLDVAVRKFKFKWPHEIIRDARERKELKK